MINNDNNITSSPNLDTHTTDYTNTKRPPTISFATHNVHSLQCDLKNELIKDTFLDFDTDFVSLTETCHRSNQTYKNKHDPNFSSFWSSNINTHAVVGLLIKRTWSNYVQKSFLNSDRFIYVDLFLPGHIKLRIFSIYLHAKRNASVKIERLKSDFKIILLGDFNANLDKYWIHINEGHTLHWRYDFYQRIFALNFLDLYDICHDSPQPTFFSTQTNTRIDSIFASPNLISDFLYSYIDTTDMYKSDHSIVFASFADISLQSQAKSRILLNKRHVPNFKAMNPTQWGRFAEYTNFHYNQHNLDRFKDLSPNLANMNSLWTAIKTATLSASRKEIPHIWISPTQKAKQLYDTPDSLKAAKKVGSILLMFKQHLLQQKLWPMNNVWLQIAANLKKIIDK